ncbi:MAG: DsbA family oxidoreductase [Pseudomonadota bacterium]
MAPPPQSIEVQIVSDVVCPWCAIGFHALAKAAASLDLALAVRWIPFELNPQIPPAGENLREHLAAKYGATLEGSIKARQRLTALGAELGFTFNYADDMRMWNTFRAHQLIAWAAEQRRAHDMKMALFQAYFTERRNISDIDALAEIAGSIGLDAAAAREGLMSEVYAEGVREEELAWMKRGVTGVPLVVFEGQHAAPGAQDVETYRAILRKLTAQPIAAAGS